MANKRKRKRQNQKRQQQNLPCYISELTPDILAMIFTKLPIATLSQCRYVCKSWKHVLSKREFGDFAKLHRQPSSLILCLEKDKEETYWLEFMEKSYHFDLVANFCPSRCEFINSCNGLLCVYWHGNLCVLNPITWECMAIDKGWDGEDRDTDQYRLGFSSMINQFKVIRIYEEDCDVKAQICTLTLSTLTWRSIEVDPPFNSCDIVNWDWNPSDTFLNGCFHWLVLITDDEMDYLEIWVFDFEIEQFSSMALPNYQHEFDMGSIGVFEESLYFCCIFQGDVRIWLRNEDSVHASWMKWLVIENRMNFWKGSSVEVMMLLGNENVLLLSGSEMLVYNARSKNCTKLQTNGSQPEVGIIIHHPHLAPLKDVVGGISALSLT